MAAYFTPEMLRCVSTGHRVARELDLAGCSFTTGGRCNKREEGAEEADGWGLGTGGWQGRRVTRGKGTDYQGFGRIFSKSPTIKPKVLWDVRSGSEAKIFKEQRLSSK